MSCSAVSDKESLLLLTTDKRELFVYYRSAVESDWQLLVQTTSPHPDIYYTSLGCLSLVGSMDAASQEASSVLLFLCGTDYHISVMNLSIPSKTVTKLFNLTVVLCFTSMMIRVLRIGFLLFDSTVILIMRMASRLGV